MNALKIAHLKKFAQLSVNKRFLLAAWTKLNIKSYHNERKHEENNGNSRNIFFAAGIATVGVAGLLYFQREKFSIKALSQDTAKSNYEDFGKYIEGLPVYTSEDVAKNNDPKQKIWISYKSGVYDITEFVTKHPGGEKILMAAGGSVEPFWALYAVHQRPEVLTMLEEYRIGNLTKGEETLAMANVEDPYASDPKRHPLFIVRSAKPFNAEPPSFLLAENYITPTEIFYIRNHLPVPSVETASFSLEIDGLPNKVQLSLDDLKSKFPKHSVTAALQCAGNRRSEMNEEKPVKGLQWAQGAMGNAQWGGAKLRDVLLAAGYREDENTTSLHVQFEGLDTDPANLPYGASIPLTKALDPYGDVIIAYEMNGEPLTRDHGYPLRVVVPGSVGARWVKWLTRIEISADESPSHWQQNDYKSFSPSTDWHNVDFKTAPAIQDLPVMSVICEPQNLDKVKLKDGHLPFKGYAWSGGGRGIVRVDVSADQGKTWHVAELLDNRESSPYSQAWAWTRWSVELPITQPNGNVEVWVKAIDSAYNSQPENMAHIWNLRGLMANAYHKIKVKIEP